MDTNWAKRLVWLGMIVGTVAFWIWVLSMLLGCAGPAVTGDRPWYIHKRIDTRDGWKDVTVLLCDRPLPAPQSECYAIFMGGQKIGGRRGKAVELEVVEEVR